MPYSHLGVEIFLTIATPTAQACAQALKKSPHMRKTPMLFTAVTDPVGAGLVKGLKRPGFNIAGVSDMLPVDRHLTMVKAFLPQIERLGFLYNAGEVNSKVLVPLFQATAEKMGFEIVEAAITKSSDVYQAAKSLVGKVDAVFIPTDDTVVSALETAIKVCEQKKLPLFNADVDSVKRGSIAAMGFDYYKHGVQTGELARRILNGADPASTPVEFQQRLQLHINTHNIFILGVGLSNALVAVSGAPVAQNQGASDVNMGIGTIIAGMASVILGETVFGRSGVARACIAGLLG